MNLVVIYACYTFLSVLIILCWFLSCFVEIYAFICVKFEWLRSSLCNFFDKLQVCSTVQYSTVQYSTIQYSTVELEHAWVQRWHSSELIREVLKKKSQSLVFDQTGGGWVLTGPPENQTAILKIYDF